VSVASVLLKPRSAVCFYILTCETQYCQDMEVGHALLPSMICKCDLCGQEVVNREWMWSWLLKCHE